MIEKYFSRGLVTTWSPPAGGSGTGAKPDGSIIPNPVVSASAIVYNCMDGEIYDLTAPHVATLGLTKGVHIPHDWLVYAPGFTTRMTITNDTLTGFMSGCPILYYRDNGVPTVAHVGTSNEYPALNPAVKSTIKAAIPPGATGFNPAGEWSKDAQFEAATTVKPPGTPRVVALVTTTGAFYSILLVQKSKPLTEFIVAGIKQVRAKTGGELDTLLT